MYTKSTGRASVMQDSKSPLNSSTRPFNNLLTAITGYTDLLLINPEVGIGARAEVGEIQKIVRRAADLINQLLAFSRKQSLEPRILDVKKVVLHLVDMLERLIGSNVELKTNLADDTGSIRADPGQLEQVILNLAVNAREAMPDGGRLEISTRGVSSNDPVLAGQPELQNVEYSMIEVADNGMGMEEEVSRHIFEPFFTTKSSGTGLGLATVHGIISQSGGHISVESKPESGSSFKVFLPRVEEGAETIVGSEAASGPIEKTGVILVVEDEEMLRGIVSRVLETRGFTVLSTGDAQEALRESRFHHGEIQLLLTDLVMPGGMGGRELAEILETERPKMPILFMSGFGDSEFPEKDPQKPNRCFLRKPFDADTLVQKVQEVLRSS